MSCRASQMVLHAQTLACRLIRSGGSHAGAPISTIIGTSSSMETYEMALPTFLPQMVAVHLQQHVFCVNLYVRKVSGAAETAIYMAIIKVSG